MPRGQYERKITSKPFVSKNANFDAHRCDCGVIMNGRSPQKIERHNATKRHVLICGINTNEERDTGAVEGETT